VLNRRRTGGTRDARAGQLPRAWLDKQTVPDGSPLTGVQFASQHGDELALWAVSERVDDTSALTSCTTAPADRSTCAIPSSLRPCRATDSPGLADQHALALQVVPARLLARTLDLRRRRRVAAGA